MCVRHIFVSNFTTNRNLSSKKVSHDSVYILPVHIRR